MGRRCRQGGSSHCFRHTRKLPIISRYVSANIQRNACTHLARGQAQTVNHTFFYSFHIHPVAVYVFVFIPNNSHGHMTKSQTYLYLRMHSLLILDNMICLVAPVVSYIAYTYTQPFVRVHMYSHSHITCE